MSFWHSISCICDECIHLDVLNVIWRNPKFESTRLLDACYEPGTSGGKVRMTRVAGKYGAKPRDYSLSVPVFERFLVSPRALPAAPVFVDRMTKVRDWPMYLNNEIGDCTDAGMLHSVQAMTAFTGRVAGGAIFDDIVPLQMYEATGGYVPGDPSTDNGATLEAVADFMTKVGVRDTRGDLHKLVAWAQVGDPTNLDLLKRILNTFGSVYCAFDILQANEQQFAQSEVWSVIPGSPMVGGHCIPMQYSAFGATVPHRAETFITWGAEQPAEWTWVRSQISEALVLVSEDWLELNGKTIEGLDLNSLIKEMHFV